LLVDVNEENGFAELVLIEMAVELADVIDPVNVVRIDNEYQALPLGKVEAFQLADAIPPPTSQTFMVKPLYSTVSTWKMIVGIVVTYLPSFSQ
jgi:hypothetical protein